MPPPETKMVFEGTSPRALCELTEHMSSPLVLWGWDPGTGRTPVAVPHQQFLAAFKRWRDAGAPCPPPARTWWPTRSWWAWTTRR